MLLLIVIPTTSSPLHYPFPVLTRRFLRPAPYTILLLRLLSLLPICFLLLLLPAFLVLSLRVKIRI